MKIDRNETNEKTWFPVRVKENEKCLDGKDPATFLFYSRAQFAKSHLAFRETSVTLWPGPADYRETLSF